MFSILCIIEIQLGKICGNYQIYLFDLVNYYQYWRWHQRSQWMTKVTVGLCSIYWTGEPKRELCIWHSVIGQYKTFYSISFSAFLIKIRHWSVNSFVFLSMIFCTWSAVNILVLKKTVSWLICVPASYPLVQAILIQGSGTGWTTMTRLWKILLL